MAVSITDTDKGFAALLARLTGSRSFSMTVGIHESEGAQTHRPSPREKVRQKAKDKGKSKEQKAKDKKARKEESITMAELGEIHEFGLGVPQRSFIGDWVDETESQKNEQMRGVARALVQGEIESIEDGFEQLGNLYVAQIQKRIASGIEPALAEATIKAKGSSVPLEDTGQLRGSITYEVQKGMGRR